LSGFQFGEQIQDKFWMNIADPDGWEHRFLRNGIHLDAGPLQHP
jgi:hypothetical protein